MKHLKKYILILGIVMAGICLSGCTTSVISLTDEENKEVARYIADVIMQHDINYKKTELIYEEPETEAEPTETPTPSPVPVTPTPSQMPGQIPGDITEETDGEDVQDESIEWSELFKTDKWEINYSSYDTCSEYPKNSDLYRITAEKGNELIVLFFDVKNLTDKKIKVNLTDNELKYKLVIGEESYESKLAILETGGLMFLNTKIPAGKTITSELIFEVPKGLDLSEMRLDVSK